MLKVDSILKVFEMGSFPGVKSDNISRALDHLRPVKMREFMGVLLFTFELGLNFLGKCEFGIWEFNHNFTAVFIAGVLGIAILVVIN